MWHYGGYTPKPHWGYGNSPWISLLDKGPLKDWKRKSLEEGRPMPKTCEQYVNSKGAKCYKGTKFLKKTEILKEDSAPSYKKMSLSSKVWGTPHFDTGQDKEESMHMYLSIYMQMYMYIYMCV